MTAPIEYVDQKRPSEIILDIYPGKKTTGYLYEDDGETFDHDKGAYSLTKFTWANGKLKVDRKKTGFKSAAQKHRALVQSRKV
jgi:alpha-glucosidase (family GH31 glycosyl hydrolase)